MPKFSKDQMEQLKKDFQVIVDKNFDVGMDSISPLMKQMVEEQSKEDDLSTSGYWVRAQQMIKEYDLLGSINLVSNFMKRDL